MDEGQVIWILLPLRRFEGGHVTMTRIGIVGVGPRGLTILERIVANERAHKSTDIEVYLFDTNHPGVGCHDPEQSEYLLVNTVAGQITQFCDASVVGAGPLLRGQIGRAHV